MGTKANQDEQYVDKEKDPKVADRRNALFQQYVAPFYNMIYKLCIKYSFSSHDVEDNYTEVLVNFFRMIESYDPNRPIRTWLHICTKRHVYALERKRQVKSIPICDDNDIDTFEDLLPCDNEHISENTMGIDNYRELYSDDVLSVLDELKPIHRDAFLLQMAGHSLKEIAEIAHRNGTLKSKNIETIKSRLFLARQYLKRHLTRSGDRIPDTTDDEGFYSYSNEPD